jgi:Mg2+ and Co2+ transporter CorA
MAWCLTRDRSPQQLAWPELATWRGNQLYCQPSSTVQPAPAFQGEEPPEVEPEASVLWVDLIKAGADELDRVGQLFDLNRRAMRMAIAPWQRPRLTAYPASFFVAATVPHLRPSYHVSRLNWISLLGLAFWL